MMKKMIVFGFIVIAGLVRAETLFSNSFTASEGFSNGKSINQIANWDAMDGLNALDTEGGGCVRPSANWLRARNKTFFSLHPLDRVVLTSVIKIQSPSSVGDPVFSFGILDSARLSSSAVSVVAPVLTVYAHGLGFGENKNKKIWGSLDDVRDDMLRLTVAIEKSETPGEFNITCNFYNETDDVNLGQISWVAEDRATWDAQTLCAAMRNMNSVGHVDALDIHSFKVELFVAGRLG